MRIQYNSWTHSTKSASDEKSADSTTKRGTLANSWIESAQQGALRRTSLETRRAGSSLTGPSLDQYSLRHGTIHPTSFMVARGHPLCCTLSGGCSAEEILSRMLGNLSQKLLLGQLSADFDETRATPIMSTVHNDVSIEKHALTIASI